MNRNLLPISLAVLSGAPVMAQSFQGLVDTRNGAQPYASNLQFEVGAIGTLADGSGHSAGLEDDISWDSRIYYRDEAFGSRRGAFEAYVGRDGIFAGKHAQVITCTGSLEPSRGYARTGTEQHLGLLSGTKWRNKERNATYSGTECEDTERIIKRNGTERKRPYLDK